MDLDTRSQARRILGAFRRSIPAALARVLACGLAAVAVALLPGFFDGAYRELSLAAQIELGILVFAALLWMSEAMPAFAVALLVIGLQIALLGRPGGPLVAPGDVDGWRMFVAPWASPMMWLFLGGFVMAHSCTRTGLDRWMAAIALGRLTGGTAGMLAGVMAMTFLLSMFMSNTATAAMMLAVVGGLTRGLAASDSRPRALFLGVAVAASLGGMGTLIGSPPNAIAAGELAGGHAVDFLGWILVALPPALLLCALAYLFLWWRYLRGNPKEGFSLSAQLPAEPNNWRRRLVMSVFFVTVLLWMSESLHGIPTPVISFLPIVVFAITGVVGSDDLRQLPWEVLLLLAGGLSLGVGVEATGLAEWLVGLIPDGVSLAGLSVLLVLLAVTLSNMMSNTAAASLLIPIGAGLAGAGSPAMLVIPIALGCSAAMALPISTPPNALAFASGRVASRDFLGIGTFIGLAGTVLLVLWSRWILAA
jgi:sodium-dependent dicarboxylate transporter 2/3/5